MVHGYEIAEALHATFLTIKCTRQLATISGSTPHAILAIMASGWFMRKAVIIKILHNVFDAPQRARDMLLRVIHII